MTPADETTPGWSVTVEMNVIEAGTLAELSAKSSAELFDIATDTTVHRLSRSAAIDLLSERGAVALLERLPSLLTDADTPSDVRSALLAAIADHRIERALPTLQWLCTHIPPEHDGRILDLFIGFSRESLLAVRGMLGDVTALRDLIRLNYLHWPPAPPLAGVIDKLGGLSAAVAVLSSATGSVEQQLQQLAAEDDAAELRRWAIDRLAALADDQPVEFYAERLGDPVGIVAAGASDVLVRLAPSASANLRPLAGNAANSDSHRLWAVYTLLRMGFAADDLLAQIPNHRIPLPATIAPLVRQAIVRKWADSGGPRAWTLIGTDIRWLIEKQQLPADASYDAATLMQQLRAGLQAAGLPTGEPVDCGEYHRQGDGTYWLLPLVTHEEYIERYLYISQLGPFASYVIHIITRDEYSQGVSFHLTQLADVDPSGTWQEQSIVCKQVAEEAGFTWIAESMLEVVVPRLCYLYPYSPAEITVRSLLYYWMD